MCIKFLFLQSNLLRKTRCRNNNKQQYRYCDKRSNAILVYRNIDEEDEDKDEKEDKDEHIKN